VEEGRRAFDVETALRGDLPFYFVALIWHLEENGAGRLWRAWVAEFPGLSAWTAKSLAFESIVTVVDLVCRSEADLPHKTVNEINDKLAERGLSSTDAGLGASGSGGCAHDDPSYVKWFFLSSSPSLHFLLRCAVFRLAGTGEVAGSVRFLGGDYRAWTYDNWLDSYRDQPDRCHCRRVGPCA
jgi:hypothetical protein